MSRRQARACGVAAVSAVLLAGRASAAQQAPAVIGAAAPASVAVASAARGPRRVTASRAAPHAVVVDGRLDERAWEAAAAAGGAAGGFVQQRPDPGAAAAQRSEARVLYDDAAVYVAMRLYDSAPDSIAAPLGRRDYEGYSDWAHVIIDSYFDRRTAFRFAVNPSGVKRDAFLSGDNEWSEDASWDAVWDAAAARDSLGWAAEFRIPLTQLRFSTAGTRDGGRGMNGLGTPRDSASLTWGVQFARDLARRNERSFWAPVPPDAGAFVSLFGTLVGLRGIEAPRRLEVAPYTVARLTRSPVAAGDPLHRRTAPAGSAGADVKYGLTSDLTLTATVLPDFGQVEADPSQVNLTGLQLFFSERRPFFIEGGDLFRFPLSTAGWAFGPEQLFYTRRIGRAPQGAVPDGARFSDAPDATTLLGAVKLSGKTAGGWSVGALSAVTAAEEARYVSGAGERAAHPVEPLTSYSVARVMKDLRQGRSAVGGVVTAVNRRLEGRALDFLRGSAYAGGVDWRHRFGPGDNFYVSGNLIGSEVRGTAEAIAETQRSPNHYFQRPDAARRLGVDSARTSLAGLSSELRLGKQGGAWRWAAIGHVVTPGFEVNDAGFGNGSDYGSLTGWVGYVHFRPGRLAQRWEAWTNHWWAWTLGGEQLKNGANLFAYTQLRNQWEAYAELWHDRPSLSTTALRGGPALRLPAHAGAWLRVVMDQRRRVYPELMGSRDVELGTGGQRLTLSPALNVRPSARAELSLQPGLSWATDPAQYVATHDTLGVRRFVAGWLSQTTASLTARASYTFTPALSFQLYAQPFVSGGRYAAFHEVRAPSARRFADRFRTIAPRALTRDAGGDYSVDADGDGAPDFGFADPSFNVRDFQSNAVLRWEYRPGSALFVVWSQSRDGGGVDGVRGGPGAFHFGDDARRLFAARATNVLLVKVSYWMSP